MLCWFTQRILLFTIFQAILLEFGVKDFLPTRYIRVRKMYFMEVSFIVTTSIINSIAEERKSNIKDRSTWSLLALLFLYISHRVCDRRAMTPYCF